MQIKKNTHTNSDHRCPLRKTRVFTPKIAIIAMLYLVGAAGIAYAGFDTLVLFECSNCAQGPNDVACVFGKPAFCNPETQACITVAQDVNNDGQVDTVDNICITRN